MDAEISDLLADVRAYQDRVLRTQQAVEQMEIGGSASGGDVTVRLRGTGRLIEVVIDPLAVRRYDVHELAEIVRDAVNDGLDRLGQLTRLRFAGPDRNGPC